VKCIRVNQIKIRTRISPSRSLLTSLRARDRRTNEPHDAAILPQSRPSVNVLLGQKLPSPWPTTNSTPIPPSRSLPFRTVAHSVHPVSNLSPTDGPHSQSPVFRRHAPFRSLAASLGRRYNQHQHHHKSKSLTQGGGELKLLFHSVTPWPPVRDMGIPECVRNFYGNYCICELILTL